MLYKSLRMAACTLAVAITVSGSTLYVEASTVSSALPAAGLGLTLEEGSFVKEVKEEVEQKNTTDEEIENTVVSTTPEESVEIVEPTPVLTEEQKEDRRFATLVIAQVDNYVNVRGGASEESEIVGKLYDNSVGEFIQEVDGWYEIQSGNCTGFVKAEYCVTGEEAVSLAREVGVRIATVNTDLLRVRQEPSLEASVLGTIPINDHLIVLEENDQWIKVDIEEGAGYVSAEYIELSTEFVTAESKEEEEARLAAEAAERAAAQAAAEAARAAQEAQAAAQSTTTAATTTTASGSGTGTDVANYALQFVGNPYVWGGTSLTNGADCSGFVMSVYANFGVSLPHSSSADRNVGSDVGGLANAQAGDIVCYSGHVGIYIGNGQIVHASTSDTGIIVSNADYRTPLTVRRIF